MNYLTGRASTLLALALTSIASAPSALGGIDVLLRTGEKVGPEGFTIESFAETSLGSGSQAAVLADLTRGKGDTTVKVKAVVLAGKGGPTIVAREGGPAPSDGDTAQTFSKVREPFLSSTGHLAFVGQTGAKKAAGDTVGLYAHVGGKTARLVRGGAAIRMRDGKAVTFSGLARPQLIGQRLYFLGEAAAKAGLYVLMNRRVEKVVAVGDPVPGVSGAKFSEIQEYGAAKGRVVLLATFAGGRSDKDNNMGLFAARAGSPRLIARLGVPWSGGPATQSIVKFVDRPVVAPNGVVAFLAEVKDASSGRSGPAAFIAADGTPKLIVGTGRVSGGGTRTHRDDGREVAKGSTGRPRPGAARNRPPSEGPAEVSAGDIRGISALAINSAGQLAVLATVAGGASDSAGAFVIDGDQVRGVLRKGQPVGTAAVASLAGPLAIDDKQAVCLAVGLDTNETVLALATPKPPRRTGRIITNHPGEEPGFGRQKKPRSKRQPKADWEKQKPRVGRPNK